MDAASKMSGENRPANQQKKTTNSGADLRVLVLRGGPSPEREVSLESGVAVAEALAETGFVVTQGDVHPNDLSVLDGGGFDVVFPVLHGTFGEDGQLQAILEERGLCYAGSNAASSQLAMNKYQSKESFVRAGLAVAYSQLLQSQGETGSAKQTELWAEQSVEQVGVPCVVKPNQQGSSIGVVIANDHKEALEATKATLAEYGDCLIERFVGGRELTVGILAGKALPVLEVRTGYGFYDYRAKYLDNNTQYLFDIDLDNALLEAVQAEGERAFAALGCRDFGRVDMIVDEQGRVCILEVNTIPGFTGHSLLPKAAERAGIGMGQMCAQIVRMAYDRSMKNV